LVSLTCLFFWLFLDESNCSGANCSFDSSGALHQVYSKVHIVLNYGIHWYHVIVVHLVSCVVSQFHSGIALCASILSFLHA
jgi:hypothetical protein